MNAQVYVFENGLLVPRVIDVPEFCRAGVIKPETLRTNFERTEFLWPRLADIKACLDAGLYRMALLGALTVPDICGRLEFPDIKEDSKRYAKWFDENVYNYNIGTSGRDGRHFDCLNGYMCYLLRCRVVHGEPVDIEDVPNRPASALVRRGYNKVVFRFTDKTYSEFFDIRGLKDEPLVAMFYVGIPQLVMWIISNAEGFFEENVGRYSFDEAYTFEQMTV